MANSRTVFVGNVSWDASEEQVMRLMSSVGPVFSLRMMIDRDTNKSRGYGFCEYHDVESAQAAMRTLNGTDFMGRQIKIGASDRQDPGHGRSGQSGPAAPAAPGASSSSGHEAVAAATAAATDALNQTQLVEMVGAMKVLAARSPEQARAVLASNPQLSYALLQAEVLMGMVETTVAQSFLRPVPPANAGPVPPAYPGAVPPPPPPPMPGVPPPAPVPGMPYHPMMPHTAVGVVPPPEQVPLGETDARLIVQVMQMTTEEINALPPDQRAQVIELRNALAGTMPGGPAHP